MQVRFEHRFDDIARNSMSCTTVLLVFICVTFILVAYQYPHNMVTYSRQEQFRHNIAGVTGSKLTQPLFDKIKDWNLYGHLRVQSCSQSPAANSSKNQTSTWLCEQLPSMHQQHALTNDCDKHGPNVRSKALAINEDIIKHKWDDLAIIETWLKVTGAEGDDCGTDLATPSNT